jgi:hypothetical protein
MLPGDLCNPAQMGTMTTPDSTYEWRNFGEHVSRIEFYLNTIFLQ